MNKILIPFANPIAAVNKSLILDTCKKVLDRGSFVLGQEVEKLEYNIYNIYRSFFAGQKHLTGSERVVAVGSGTDALEIAVRSLMESKGWKVKDTHIVTVANSAPATVTPFLKIGFDVRFTDVDHSGLMSIESLDKQLAVLAKDEAADCRGGKYHIIVVPVDLYGQPCDILSISNTIALHFPDALIVRDGAQSFGIVPDDIYSDAIAISFYPTKNLGCFGDGGAILFEDLNVATIARSLRFYGITDRENLTQERYGYNSRLDEMQAAFLNCQLETWQQYLVEKKRIAGIYYELIDDDLIMKYECNGNHHIFPTLVDNRPEIIFQLGKRGIGTAIHYKTPAHLQPAFIKKGYPDASLPVTEWLCKGELSLPIWPGMKDVEILYVGETFNKVAKEYA